MNKLVLAALASLVLAPAAYATQKPATGWTFKSRPNEEIGCRLTAPGTAEKGVIKNALEVVFAEGYLSFTFRGARDASIFFDGEMPVQMPGEHIDGNFVSFIRSGGELVVLKDIQDARALFTVNGAAYFVDITAEGRDALKKMRQCVKGQLS